MQLSILINAYACSPNMGSEPGMAWNWCVNLANHCELHIITEGEFKEKIEAVLPNLPQGKNMHFYYNPVSDKIRKMCWNQGDWRFYYYYQKWQKTTYEIAKKIIEDKNISIIHQLNMVGFREPGYLWKINKPFIWGPIAGIGSIPFSFLKDIKLKKRIILQLKDVITNIQLHHSPRVKSALQKAYCVMTVAPEAQKKIYQYHKVNTILVNETGCFGKTEVNRTNATNNTFKILWVGRFIYTKQLKMALDVVQKVSAKCNISFHIIGQALAKEKTEEYKEYAKLLGIDNICIWHGQVANEDVLKIMQESDLFFFTSIFEATSTVILEAITNQLPILCFDTCGFGPLIDKSIGIKIKLNNYKQAVEDFSLKLEKLYHNRELLSQMSLNCIKHKERLSWENKAKQMVKLYDKCLENEAKKY